MNEEPEEPDAEEPEKHVAAGEPEEPIASETAGEHHGEGAPEAARPGWFAVYLAAFALVVGATAVMAFGGLSLLRTGSTIEGSTTLFWVSIVLAVVAIVLAGASLVLARKRH